MGRAVLIVIVICFCLFYSDAAAEDVGCGFLQPTPQVATHGGRWWEEVPGLPVRSGTA